MKKISNQLLLALLTVGMGLTSCDEQLDNAVTPVVDEKGKVTSIEVDLSKITEDYTAQDGTVLTGTLGENVIISIADGATVTLKDVTINGTSVTDNAYNHAGITSGDNSTIILEGTNTVKGFHENYPGIHVPEGNTLTIQGTGTLNASSNGWGAGIGGGYLIPCGNIVIKGGTVEATGGKYAAGIGGGASGSCGNIEISGGTVDATGGECAAGIGGGDSGICGSITISGGTVDATGAKWAAGIGGGNRNKACGTITITSDVTKVTAETGGNDRSIGKGDQGQDITVTIEAGANVTATGHALSASVVGEIVGSDGKAYVVGDKDILPSGVTAVAMVAYKSGSNGLAIQLNGSPVSKNWADAKTYAEGLDAVPGGTWRLPSKEDWQNMFVGCAVSGDASAGDNMNPIAGFKEKIVATGITWLSFFYWSSLGSGSFACYVLVSLNGSNAKAVFNNVHVSNEYPVLGCLAF